MKIWPDMKTRSNGTKAIVAAITAWTLIVGAIGVFIGDRASSTHLQDKYILLDRELWTCHAGFLMPEDENNPDSKLLQICVVYRVKGLDLTQPSPKIKNDNYPGRRIDNYKRWAPLYKEQ